MAGFIYSIEKYLSGTYHVSSTLQSTGNMQLDREGPCLHGVSVERVNHAHLSDR